MEPIHYLDEGLMEKICHKLAVDFFDTIEEPIAKFNDHNQELLDSEINSPKQTFDKKDLYPTLANKAGVLYYSLNKNHPSSNGNKRIATASLVVFLYINNYMLLVQKDELLTKTLEIAKSKPEDRERILKEVGMWIKNNVVSKEEYKNLTENNDFKTRNRSGY